MASAITCPPSVIELHAQLGEARQRTLELISDLSDEQMIGPRVDIVNPLRWEVGHVGYFQEYWVLRHFRGEAPTRPEGDSLYDSARIAHDTRWDLPIPSKADTLAYIQRILERVTRRDGIDVGRKIDGYDESYFIRLALLHECMHAEAITYTRQTLGYTAPKIGTAVRRNAREQPAETNDGRYRAAAGPLGDTEVPGGTFMMGSTPDQVFIFDNEQWAHPLTLRAFRIARTAVSNAEFTPFVEDGGYERRELWTDEGWCWRENAQAHPVYWQRQAGGPLASAQLRHLGSARRPPAGAPCQLV